jgi:hypothetical protein
MAATSKRKTTVWRWQERFVEAGVGGLLCNKSRPPGKARISTSKTAGVVPADPNAAATRGHPLDSAIEAFRRWRWPANSYSVHLGCPTGRG